MPEELQVVARRNQTHAPTLRDLAAVFFRHKRLLRVSFLVALTAGIIYAMASPSYRSEMKVLLRRGRIDPAITPSSGSAALQRDEISEVADGAIEALGNLGPYFVEHHSRLLQPSRYRSLSHPGSFAAFLLTSTFRKKDSRHCAVAGLATEEMGMVRTRSPQARRVGVCKIAGQDRCSVTHSPGTLPLAILKADIVHTQRNRNTRTAPRGTSDQL